MAHRFEEVTEPNVTLPCAVAAPVETAQTISTPGEHMGHNAPAESFDTLLAHIEQETSRYNRKARQLSGLLFGSIILPLSYMAAIFLYFTPRQLRVPIWPNFAYIALVYCSVLVSLRNVGWYRRYIAQIAEMEDGRAVGPLLDYLADGKLRPGIEIALTRLLPRLNATDAGSLTPARRDRLCRELARNRCPTMLPTPLRRQNSAYAVAILKAFEQVGSEYELPEVRALTNGSIRGVSPDVQAAAWECLPFMEQRVQAQQSRIQLLRAAPLSASGELLRAADTDNMPPTRSAELLLASSSPPPSPSPQSAQPLNVQTTEPQSGNTLRQA